MIVDSIKSVNMYIKLFEQYLLAKSKYQLLLTVISVNAIEYGALVLDQSVREDIHQMDNDL